jgi:adenine deaminase
MYGRVLDDLREMHRAHVRILPGSDAAVALIYPGSSLRDELGYFVDKIGMTPMEALISATRSAAEFSGTIDSLGTIQVGKLADLVLLDENPLADIRNVGRIHAVITRGELFDRVRLDSVLAAARRRGPRSGSAAPSRRFTGSLFSSAGSPPGHRVAHINVRCRRFHVLVAPSRWKLPRRRCAVGVPPPVGG